MANLANLIVRGASRLGTVVASKVTSASFIGNLTGTADKAKKVVDSYNSQDLTITYGKAGQSSTSWLASWNGTELGAISPSNITAGNASKVNNLTVQTAVPANAVFTDTKYAATTASIGSASAGTAIAADDITEWSAGSTPTLGTAIAADDITAWSAGSAASADVANGVLTITNGSVPSLTYTARTIPNVTGVGSVPTLKYTARSIPNISVTATTVATGIKVS